jgi:cytochrome c-type biogenesis protein CcmF
MIAEVGLYALMLAFSLAILQGVAPLIGASQGNITLMKIGPLAARGHFFFIAVAFGALMYANIVSDFSIAIVAQHSHTLKPMLYKVAGVWGNHEGSMLLWVLVLSFFGVLIAEFGHKLPVILHSRVLGIQGIIGLGFLAFILFTSNPFTRLDPAPIEGSGLNPLLQDPGLAFHPPFLYLGYVGFSVAFSFAIAALIEGRVDPAWARWVRPWTMAAWTTLTIGIALGSWWAYYELGWGGWWFWDPVENASFMPWLVGTALLHSALVVEKRDTIKTWTIFLAIMAFGMSLLGTFLVRSGVLTSVHTFATDPERGVFILVLLIFFVGGGLTLFAIRAPAIKGTGSFSPISREGALILNNLLLATACAVVFLGTLYPLALDALNLGKISVGAPYFNATFVPLMLPLLIACPIGAMLAWKQGDLMGVLERLKIAALTAVTGAICTVFFAGITEPVVALAMGISAWLVVGSVIGLLERVGFLKVSLGESLLRVRRLPRSAWSTAIAHGGLGIIVAGITASTAWQMEQITAIKPNDTVALADYQITFRGVQTITGPNYTAIRGIFDLSTNQKKITSLLPEKRTYTIEGSTTTEAAIYTTMVADVYIVLGEKNDNGAWTVRIYYNPLVPWIWAGAIFMAFGGLISLSDRQQRIGVSKRAGGTL